MTVSNITLEERILLQSKQTTRIILLIGAILWPIWIVFDYYFAPELLYQFVPVRFFFGFTYLIVALLLSKNKISDLHAQLILLLPPFILVAYMFNIVPLNAIYPYMLSGTMVLIAGFIFPIIPPKRSLFYGAIVIGAVFILNFSLQQNSLSDLVKNGGFLYLSLTLFCMGFSLLRFNNVKTQLSNAFLIEQSNEKLAKQATELEEKNSKLEDALAEREILIQEIHHRVKNNLQIVLSLLKIQESQIDKKTSKEILQLSQDRIYSMATMHDILYQSNNFNFIDFKIYIQTLVSYLQSTYQLDKKNIQFNLDLTVIEIELDKMVSCGLIINEVVTNSIKHAFQDQSTNEISILTKETEGDVTIVISDNGAGFVKEVDLNNLNSLGLKLIQGLAKQLKGQSTISSNTSGTTVTITFKNNIRTQSKN